MKQHNGVAHPDSYFPDYPVALCPSDKACALAPTHSHLVWQDETRKPKGKLKSDRNRPVL